MLDTLIRIGKWQSGKMSPIERFLSKPKLKESKTYYVANLVFDLDEQDIYMEKLKKYDEEKDVKNFLLLKIRRGNNKKIYATVVKNNFEKLLISFFGDIQKKDNTLGELYEKANQTSNDKNFLDILRSILELKEKLLNITKNSSTKIFDQLNLNKTKEDIAVITSSVKSLKYGFEKPVFISKLDGYKNFIETELLSNNSSDKKLCYVSGYVKDDVERLELEKSFSLNKMFVKTTKNYAVGLTFNDKELHKNYQVSKINQTYLDIGSDFILNNYLFDIGGIKHVMLPVFLAEEELDFDIILGNMKIRSDFLFNSKIIKKLDTNISDETDNLYWINYISYDTEKGTSFKTTSEIKDISTPWFVKIIKIIKKLNNYISYHYNTNDFYNFYTFFKYIPVKTDVNRNEALELFKDIFEHRPIDKQILFKHFTKYLIVQRSGQFEGAKHRAYPNITKKSEFDFAISNAVLNYLVFLKFLKEIKLLNYNNMQENKDLQKTGSDYKNRIENFFADMDYTDRQKGLFYLGRVLDQVARAQVRSNHTTKPIMNKLNYNGMDQDAVMRLYLDLQEKVRQYVTKLNLTSVEFDFARFIQYFNPNSGMDELTPEENVFYILSGYSFGLISSDKSTETENTENN
jgi:CRISPR-associated protein Csh1